MSVTVHIARPLATDTPGGLVYALELVVRVEALFMPFETKILNTGVRIAPQTPCVLCMGKSSRRPGPLHIVSFAAFGPPGIPSGISVEVSNPTRYVLGLQDTDLRILIFAVPLSPVRLDLLCIQRRLEEPRAKPKCPVNVLAMTPNERSLDLEVAASDLNWKPYARGNRSIATIGLDVSRSDIQRFHTATVQSCSRSDVYVDQIVVHYSTGSLYISFVTKHEFPAPPSSLAFKIVFHEEDEESRESPRITFPRYPDPTICVPQPYGMKIFNPHDVVLLPDNPTRVTVGLSYSSQGAYLGFFTPTYSDDIACQVVTWKEQEMLSMILVSTRTVHVPRGRVLGDLHFVLTNTIRTKRIAPSLYNSTLYTISICTPKIASPPDTSAADSETATNVSGDSEDSDTPPPPDRDLRIGKRRNSNTEPEPSTKRRLPPQSTRSTGNLPTLTTDRQTQIPNHSGRFTEYDQSVEIFPSGSVFKLKQLVPFLLVLGERRHPFHRGAPKKIAPVGAVRIRPCWRAPNKHGQPEPSRVLRPVRAKTNATTVAPTTAAMAAAAVAAAVTQTTAVVVTPLRNVDRLFEGRSAS